MALDAIYQRQAFTSALRRAAVRCCPVLACAPNGALSIMPAATPLTQADVDALHRTNGFPNWDYDPLDQETCPFEYKPSDWGRLDGKLVALDYSSPVDPAMLAKFLAQNLARIRRERS